MPTYKVHDSQTGRTVTLKGEGGPPTEQELEEIFAQVNTSPKPREEAPAQMSPGRTWTDTAVDALPAIGGTLGGIIGGIGGTVGGFGVGGAPGAIGGAAVGGAGGEGFKRAINQLRGKQPVDQSVGQTLRAVGGAGVREGALEAAGIGIAKGVINPVARAVTKKFFNPGERVLAQSPTVVDDILQMNIAHSPHGVAKARNLTTQARQVADRAVRDYEATGATIPRGELLNATIKNPYGYKSSYETVLERAEQTPGLDQIGRVWDNIIKDQPEDILPTAMQAIRRSEGKATKTVFEGAENPALQRQIHADLESGARNSLEKRISGFDTMNAETARRLAVLNVAKKAVAGASAKTQSVTGLDRYLTLRSILGIGTGYSAMGPLGVPAAIAFEHAIASPRLMTGIARNAYRVGKTPAIQTAGRLAEIGINESNQTAKAKRKTPVKKARVDALYKKYSESF